MGDTKPRSLFQCPGSLEKCELSVNCFLIWHHTPATTLSWLGNSTWAGFPCSLATTSHPAPPPVAPPPAGTDKGQANETSRAVLPYSSLHKWPKLAFLALL